MTPEGTDERLDAMQATIDELRAEVLALRAVSAQHVDTDPIVSDGPVSRRHALRAAGVLAAGAIAGGAGVLASASPAAAAAGTFDSSDGVNPALKATGTNGSGGVQASSNTSTGVAGTSTSGFGVWGRSTSNYGVAGFSTSTAGVSGGSDTNHGIYGSTNSDNHAGVLGQGSAYGLMGSGARALYASGSVAHIRFSPISQARSASPIMGDLLFDINGDMWLCTGYNFSPYGPIWRKLSGSNTAGSFHPVTPGRVYDSRIAGGGIGPISRGQTRTVSVANRIVNGATPALSNFVPEGATAVTLNVTISATVGSGYLAVNPGGDSIVHASTINWSSAGLSLANSTVVAVNASREVTVIANGPVGSSTNFIIDVLGYWM